MSRKHSHRRKNSAEVNLGFQIAPMIDVVFVILLYFMVAAGSQKKETSHNTKLPGTEPADTETIIPDEISIRVADDGQVYLNDDPLDDPNTKDLRELAGNLSQLKESSEASKSDVLVTIYADETAKYDRVMDVMDALSRARIGNVTFQAGAPE